jgi:hypothetical protein
MKIGYCAVMIGPDFGAAQAPGGNRSRLKTARRRREVTERRYIGLLAKYNMPGAIFFRRLTM